MATSKFAWGQPVCLECWEGLKVKIGRADNELTAEHQTCCYCKSEIKKGVTTHIQRINPNAVPYPSILKGED